MPEDDRVRISGKWIVAPLVAITAVITVVFLSIQFSGRGSTERNSLILHYMAGLRDLDDGAYASAVKNLTPVVEADAEPAAWGFRGEAYLQLEEYEKAEADFRLAIEREPQLPANHAGLAIALARQGRDEEALPHLDRAAELLESPGAPSPRTVPRSGNTLDAVLEWKQRLERSSLDADRPISNG